VTTEQQKCESAGIDPESVECPTCGAWVGWACNESHAGRYGGSHVDPFHPARCRLARKRAPELASLAAFCERFGRALDRMRVPQSSKDTTE
jgi:hypothetical protein